MSQKTDGDIINEAYESTIHQVYATFFNAMSIMQSEDDQRQIEEAFAKGIKLARNVRNIAMQLI